MDLTVKYQPPTSIKGAMLILVEALLLIFSVSSSFVIEYIMEPRQQGFFCDDSSIKYPFEEPIVPTSFLLSFFIGVPITVISFLEYARMVKNDTFKIGKWLRALEKIFTVFAFGFGLSVLTVNIFKYTLGTLRPHFMSVCNPLGVCLTNTTNTTSSSNYVEGWDDICSCSNKDLIKNARLSFMSGHASVSAFSSFFLIFYVQYRVKVEKRVLLIKPFLQFVFFILTALVSISRVADHHHHWFDVIAGFLNGTLFAAFCSFPILKFHHNRLFQEESDESSTRAEKDEEEGTGKNWYNNENSSKFYNRRSVALKFDNVDFYNQPNENKTTSPE